MARMTPRVTTDTLALTHGDTLQTIAVESDAWFTWLDSARSFAYWHNGATFTARKQQRRNGWYWYAFTRRGRRLRSVYLGRSTDLTVERLCATVFALNETSNVQLGSYSAAVSGQHSAAAMKARGQLADLYADNEGAPAQRLNLERVRSVLDVFAQRLAECRQLGRAESYFLLDVVFDVAAALAAEREERDAIIAGFQRELREAQKHGTQTDSAQPWQQGYSEVY
jgi:hypothetical protein